MKTYTIKEIEKAIKKAGDDTEKVFEYLEKTGLERIDTFEDACEVADMSDELPFNQYTKDTIEISVNAFYQLCVITKALNEDWKIDIKDKKQEVWVNWFDLRGLLAGGRLTVRMRASAVRVRMTLPRMRLRVSVLGFAFAGKRRQITAESISIISGSSIYFLNYEKSNYRKPFPWRECLPTRTEPQICPGVHERFNSSQ